MIPLASRSPVVRFFVYGYAVLIAILTGGFAGLFVASLLFAKVEWALILAAGSFSALAIWGAVRMTTALGVRGAKHAAHVLTGLLVLVILPSFGLLVDAAADPCAPHCDPNFRPLAMPEVFGLVPLQAALAVAFFIAVRRPAALRPRGEALLGATLLGGIALHALLAVQFIKVVPLAIVIIPLPIVTPYVTIPLIGIALIRRLRDRGHDALIAEDKQRREKETGYRETAHVDSDETPHFGRPVHGATLVRAFAGLPILLGIHTVVMAAIFRSSTGGADAFLKTCGYAFSQLPIPPPAENCHYLCTIAAHGDPRVVKPMRWGVRGGKPILVNRQLAIANAFEDLLHTRFPRFGRLARKTYDALAFSISRWLTRRWIANILYVLMKPAEALFMIALLLLDPDDPEARIDRMYR